MDAMAKFTNPTKSGWIIKILIVGLIFAISTPVLSDIYMYIDSEGVLHFTNTPTSSQYKLYIKERPKPSSATKVFDPIIKEASIRYGLSFSLIKAMIRVESNFNAKAVSRKGALGLMQVMPRNLKSLDIGDPFDPEQNIMGGTRYFKAMVDRFDGKLPLALAAYNAGPNTVEKYKDIPPIEETRNYVKKVMEFFYLYKNRS